MCNPCRVEIGRTSAVRAESSDPDGDTLTYIWTTKAGTLVDPRAVSTNWIAEAAPGPVPLTVTVYDGKGGVAADTVNLEVVLPPAPALVIEDVYFDFNQDNLKPDVIPVLDRIVNGLRQNTNVGVIIEGHTSIEGTEVYNFGLGERRAARVQQYLQSNGIDASRLKIISFGEANPKYDNSTEEGRRMNRRAGFVVAPN